MGSKHSEGDEMGEICLAKEDYSYKHSHYPAKGKGNIVRSPNKVLDFANRLLSTYLFGRLQH
jgi:hypothetical protein